MNCKKGGSIETRIQQRHRCLLLIGFVSTVIAICGVGIASASPVGEAIADGVDIVTYRHYLQDLLYARLGDDRGFGSEHDLARDNIVEVLSSFDLVVELEPFPYNDLTYYNVVATQLGTEFPDEVYVVGAHFDSANNPGADDNGSGTAVVMEVARVISQHRSARTIRYVLFDREEQGLRGSKAFVADHADEAILMAVTADMIGHDSGDYAMNIYGRSTSANVVNGVADAIDTYGDGLDAFVNLGDFGFSDHASFESAGIPACVIIERCYSCNPYYHTLNDAVDVEPDYIDYPMIEDLLRSVVGYLVDEFGISLYGDDDDDADVDMLDVHGLQSCFGVSGDAACVAYDFDRDGDVDHEDYAAFYLVISGPTR